MTTRDLDPDSIFYGTNEAPLGALVLTNCPGSYKSDIQDLWCRSRGSQRIDRRRLRSQADHIDGVPIQERLREDIHHAVNPHRRVVAQLDTLELETRLRNYSIFLTVLPVADPKDTQDQHD